MLLQTQCFATRVYSGGLGLGSSSHRKSSDSAKCKGTTSLITITTVATMTGIIVAHIKHLETTEIKTVAELTDSTHLALQHK